MNPLLSFPSGKAYRACTLFLFFLLAHIGTLAQTDSTQGTAYPLRPGRSGGLYLNNPNNFGSNVVFNPETGNYEITQTIGGRPVGLPTILTAEEYRKSLYQQQQQSYWNNKNQEQMQSQGEDVSPEVAGGIIPEMNVGGETFDKIFGSNVVSIRPNGTAELIFSGVVNRQDNPIIPERNRRTTSFQFDQKIQMNVVGQIGEKLRLQTNYDTENTFDFENRMKLEYTGFEDEIIKKIELGNVSLPLTGTLITGAQSLFGIKTQMQFGRATITTVFSEQKSETSVVDVQGGARTNNFELNGDEYEENRHYFLAQYFRDTYNQSLANLPFVNSGVNITKIEVWVTNRTNSTDGTRNIVAFMDLGETQANTYSNLVSPGTMTGPYADNDQNSLNPSDLVGTYPGVRFIDQATADLENAGFEQAVDFEKMENARLLSSSDYTFDPKLGFISLNQQLNTDEVLAVAFQYTLNGETYQVGEFSTDGVQPPQNLILKMLKSTVLNVSLPIWDLMMKNVYSIGAFQVNREDFIFEIEYANDATGTPIKQIPAGAIAGERLLRVLNLDNLNANNDPINGGDGYFDFLPGITINPGNGRIYFPVVEPFGDYLRSQFNGEQAIADKYVFDALYDSTKIAAQQQATFNKFRLTGSYKSSSSSEIPLNALNVPQGSVTVTAGGIKLTENVDYTVDYTMGRVKIINEGILNSGTPIRISLENNSLFSIQTKRFSGAHLDYRLSKDFNLGASILNLTERPLTQKINSGDEPISNTIWGVDGTYYTESRFLTRLVDKLPLIKTNEISTISIAAEYANLIPGHPNAINIDDEGTSYVDDFEGAETNITLKSRAAWALASTPQKQAGLFPGGGRINDLANGYNRARIAWYVIDPIFHRNNAATPSHIAGNTAEQRDHRVREVLVREIFPNRDQNPGQPANLAVFDVAYYPNERGPYNFDVEGEPGVSQGLAPDGTLNDPESRWGGVMRKIETNNFEAANIQFIEFWMLDPFLEDPNNEGGDIYFNLGNISEDILRDSRKAFENGLPRDNDITNVDTTVWGRVTNLQSLVNAFDNDPDARPNQDIGLDGLKDAEERAFEPNGPGSNYLDRIAAVYGTGSAAYQQAQEDPAADNYNYYRDSEYDAQEFTILERYKRYNGLEGNSPTAEQSDEDYPTTGTTLPDVEDINLDQTLSEAESYYQYQVSVRKQDLVVGKNYIVDKITTNVEDNATPAVWYQFRIPVRNPDEVIGGINDYRSIRFLRMVYRNFSSPIVTRFGQLDLVRGDWREYTFNLEEEGEVLTEEPNSGTFFNISTVNIEENGNRTPIPYVLPPGIDRTLNFAGGNALTRQNEQSLTLKVCDLEDGDARAAFKNVDMDMRNYSRMKMFLHAEALNNQSLQDGEVSAFIRMGADYSNNYYEYEVPLEITAPGASSREAIWPANNEMNFDFIELLKVKQARNDAMRSDPNIMLQNRYTVTLPNGHRVTVVGVPNLSNVRTIMLGVRNPKRTPNSLEDDGMAKCAEVWFNELRLTEFNEEGGWAANARITTKLADFATVSVAGSKSTIGFGSIEKNVQERSLEEVRQYDASSNVELGKLLPEKAGVTVPMYVGVSEEVRSPKFNPLDPDILLQAALENAGTPEIRDSIKKTAENYVKRRSMNFTNVRKKPKQGGKPRLYNISNFSASYSYNEVFSRNINTISNETRDYRGSLAYNFSIKPTPFKPFGNVEAFKSSPWLKIIRDININYKPTRLSFRTDVLRNFNEMILRDNTGAGSFDPNYNKSFTLNRTYGIRYDLTENLKLDFNSVVNARIDEPDGRIETDSAKNVILENLKQLGRPTRYHHTLNGDWTLPINKIPLLDWTTFNLRYTANYDWTAGAFGGFDEDGNRLLGVGDTIGHTIQNSGNWQLNGTFNLVNLYNKIPYFEKVNQNSRRSARGRSSRGRSNQKLGFGGTMAKMVMAVQNVNFNYSNNRGMMLPGFLPESGEFGMKTTPRFGTSPTLGFVLGGQDENFMSEAAARNWLSTSRYINREYSTTSTENFTARATLEPFTSFRIDLNASRVYATNHSEYFYVDSLTGEYFAQSPVDRGNFNMSFSTWATAFVTDDKDYNSSTFQTFLTNRFEAAQEVARSRGVTQFNDTTGFPQGYSSGHQEVMIPAFLAAYSGKSVSDYTFNTFPKVPIPNWRLSYDGLSRLPFFSKYFRRFNLEHAYRSSYNVSSFTSDLDYLEDSDGNPSATRGANGDFVPQLVIGQVSISEQFSPLIKVDATMKNSLILRAEYKKDRNVSLSLNNEQITEVKGNEIVFGLGYRVKDLKIRLNIGGKRQRFKSDLNLKADLSFRENVTIIRRIADQSNIPSGGSNVITLKTSADYVLNQRFNIRFFFDRVLNSPIVSASFPTANTNVGFSVRFTLAE